MALRYRLVLGVTMTLALAFGFLHHALPGSPLPFERLHVFLFNLCSGGATLLYAVEGRAEPSGRVQAFFGTGLLYAVAAFLELYAVALALSVPLFGLVESLRQREFGWFPVDFFRRRVPIHRKFRQAALLCLSSGIAIASLVIVNAEYGHWLAYDKLQLDVFFLGYSFPVSLITMAVMFSFIELADAGARPGPLGAAPAAPARRPALVGEAAFWSVNLGVILFFLFIIVAWQAAEIVVATLLFVTVVVIYGLFLRRAPRVPPTNLLLSGMGFLIFTGLTGVAYLARYFVPLGGESLPQYLLTLHAFVALYGWNLSGLIVIQRRDGVPRSVGSPLFLGLHWLTVLVLAPLGKFHGLAALVALAAYLALLGIALGSKAAPTPP